MTAYTAKRHTQKKHRKTDINLKSVLTSMKQSLKVNNVWEKSVVKSEKESTAQNVAESVHVWCRNSHI